MKLQAKLSQNAVLFRVYLQGDYSLILDRETGEQWNARLLRLDREEEIEREEATGKFASKQCARRWADRIMRDRAATITR